MDYGIKGRTTGQVRAEMARIIRAQNPALTAKPFVPGYPVIRPYLITSDPMVPTFAAEDVIRWLLSYKLGAVRTKEKFTASGITIAFMTKEESEQMLRADVGLGLEQPHRLVCVAQIQGVWQSALTMSAEPGSSHYRTVPYCCHIFDGKTGNHLFQCGGREALLK